MARAQKLSLPVVGSFEVVRVPDALPAEQARGSATEHAIPDPAEGVIPGDWRMSCLVEVANFSHIRRHLGSVEAEHLVAELTARVAQSIPTVVTSHVGRATVQFDLVSASRCGLEPVVRRIADACAATFSIDGVEHTLTVVVGAAACPVTQVDDVRLIEEAEGALDEARLSSGPVFRDISSGAPTLDRLALIRDLPAGIEQGQMFLQYQPKVHVRRQEINSAEALIRWQHPSRALIPPNDFITIAEEAGYIMPLTLWTLEQVIVDQRLIAEDGNAITIFINISGQLLGNDAFIEQACKRVAETEVMIGFEITETAVIRYPEIAIKNLMRLADVGISIAIDDYGAGLSSLAYLKQLPAKELKIDKMFVLQLTSNSRDPLIVRSTIDLAHALDMEVTAEGVETPAALALLSVMGCDIVQGYLISRPLSISDFREFMSTDRKLSLAVTSQPTFTRAASFWKSA